jgi:regulator of cell morphogenesis and NO signaling
MSEHAIEPERSLGELVRDYPEFARVFESLDIDFCCGGDQTLRAACRERSLDVDEVRRRLLDARRDGTDERDDWESMSALVDDIVTTHHQFLREELPALGELVEKVRNVHGDSHPELAEVEREFEELDDEIR